MCKFAKHSSFRVFLCSFHGPLIFSSYNKTMKNMRWLWWIRENHWPNLSTTSGSSVSWGAFQNILVLTPPWCVWAFYSCLFCQGLRCSSISFVPSSCPRKSSPMRSNSYSKDPSKGKVFPSLEGSFLYATCSFDGSWLSPEQCGFAHLRWYHPHPWSHGTPHVFLFENSLGPH